jgi:peptidoglycan hydrolase-like amidase
MRRVRALASRARYRWSASLALLAACVPGCVRSIGAQERVAPRPAASGLPAPRAAARRALPALDREPVLRVLVARGARVQVQIDEPARLDVAGEVRWIAPGVLGVEATSDGWRITGEARAFRADGLLTSAARAPFAVDATPLFGKGRSLRLDGDIVLHAADGELELIERLPMEAYLASVVGAEMNPKWPEAALAAQAIVARSYAAARWMERTADAWDLHWHFGVDMAYHGWSERDQAVARAIAPTRGEILTFRGLPVLALFHASSGGRTEAFERVKPGVLAPDGETSIAAAMPVIDDSAALPGAAGLGLSASHGRWRLELPLSEVGAALRAWSEAGEGRPAFGVVEGVSIERSHEDSARVANVSVRHRRLDGATDGATRFTTLAAADFRLAVGPVRIRSLWWERCVTTAEAQGALLIEGRGFGHGCGLSQVSAWYLASRGETPEAIVARFYSGAVLERRY